VVVENLLGILVSPETVILPVGDTVQLTATGLLEDRSTIDLTHVAEWQTTDSAIVAISGGFDEEGIISGAAVGTAYVRATLQGVNSVVAEVAVTNAALMGLAVEPTEVTIEAGAEVQLVATAVYSDGSRADSSAQVRWITADSAVARIESGGRLVASGTGTTAIRAQWEEVLSNDVPITVLTSARADLKFTDGIVEGGNDSFTTVVTLSNTGSGGATNFYIDLFLNPSSQPTSGDYGDEWQLVDYLGPSESVDLTLSKDSVSTGEHDIVMTVDLDDEVDESNESNNSYELSVEVGYSDGGPNLTVTTFEAILDEEGTYYVVDISNTGSEDVGLFYVDLYTDQLSAPEVGEDGDRYLEVDGLKAGETESTDFYIESPCDGCWSWIFVDSYDNVAETNETDNIEGPLSVL